MWLCLTRTISNRYSQNISNTITMTEPILALIRIHQLIERLSPSQLAQSWLNYHVLVDCIITMSGSRLLKLPLIPNSGRYPPGTPIKTPQKLSWKQKIGTTLSINAGLLLIFSFLYPQDNGSSSNLSYRWYYKICRSLLNPTGFTFCEWQQSSRPRKPPL